MTIRQRLEDALEAELEAELEVRPTDELSPLPRQYGPWTCRCGCKETRSAFSVALEYAHLGESARSAVETIAEHYQLTQDEQDQLVEDVESDLECGGVRW